MNANAGVLFDEYLFVEFNMHRHVVGDASCFPFLELFERSGVNGTDAAAHRNTIGNETNASPPCNWVEWTSR